jgi:hypothetical protein
MDPRSVGLVHCRALISNNYGSGYSNEDFGRFRQGHFFEVGSLETLATMMDSITKDKDGLRVSTISKGRQAALFQTIIAACM